VIVGLDTAEGFAFFMIFFTEKTHRVIDSCDSNPPTTRMTINDLPDEVLLEIFDVYRQSFSSFSSVRYWNNKNGWLKLAHVCHYWRSVVLASPSRLRLRLYFTTDNPPMGAVAPGCLSNLPIIVDYGHANWNATSPKCFISTLKYPDRVCEIAIRGSNKRSDNLEISGALDVPFPALENFELYDFGMERISLPMSLTTSIQSLQRLRLVGAPLKSLLPLLSATRALVDLGLDCDTIFYPTKGASLLTDLQHMPHLRNLQVIARSHPFQRGIEKPPTTTVLLPELTRLRFFGDRVQTEWFVAGLAAPSLREFQISANNEIARFSPTFDFPCLSKFIRIMGTYFFAARVAVLPHPMIFLFEHPHAIHDPPSKLIIITTLLSRRLGSALSAILAAFEEIFLYLSPTYYWRHGPLVGDFPCREFLTVFCSVKVLRLDEGPEMRAVADVLRQSTDGDRSQYVFPSLEEIVVYARTMHAVDEKVRAFGLETFGPFLTARHQVGRPVTVSWNTYGEVPKCFFMEPVPCLMR
jgi:F-box-like